MPTSDQKLYTEYWLNGINSRFKIHLDNKSKERTRFYNQRARESRFRRTKIVDKDILITYSFSEILTAYYNNKWPPARTRNSKQFCQFDFSQTLHKCHVNEKLE